MENIEKTVACLGKEFLNTFEVFVVKEDHNTYYEDDPGKSSSLTAVQVTQHPWLVKEDNNYFYKDDPGESSPALVEVLCLQQPTPWVAKEDHNLRDAVVASPPAVPQLVVLSLLAYMVDRPKVEKIPAEPG